MAGGDATTPAAAQLSSVTQIPVFLHKRTRLRTVCVCEDHNGGRVNTDRQSGVRRMRKIPVLTPTLAPGLLPSKKKALFRGR